MDRREVLACRFCGAPLSHVFVDLGASPLANSYLEPEDLGKAEPFYPLCVYVCDQCFLVQLPEEEKAEAIFSDYAYFSSYSESWLRHAETYAHAMIDRFGLGASHQVIEIASNDGYLLRWFKERGIPVLGIEPARNVAAAAEEAGIPTLVKFFGEATARELAAAGTRADLLVGNNVLAHVPDLNDFVAGLKVLLAPSGVLTMEFPHLLRLMEEDQFDTIYHEHYSYFSFTTVRKVFAAHGMTLFDVEELSTHGGSLRIYTKHDEDDSKSTGERVGDLLVREETARLGCLPTYRSFDERVRRVKRGLLRFLIQAKEEGKSIAAYGAPAKGNTLLNYCGIRTDFIDYTVDRSPHKQGRYLPGTRIPIHAPDRLREARPDYVLILPWNLKEEIVEQMADVRSWGGRFVVAIPEVRILE
ncbi:MAG TPA: class I SAM-dependent methyltransferase [Thermoanaerobaculia bacterium]|jgi:SAM-dependent methyltransferase|nr:class I SAM-dependent methyltransferase [Thermoanaerobaculia bacterium]